MHELPHALPCVQTLQQAAGRGEDSREPDGIWRQVAAERDLGVLNRQLVLATWLPLSVHGVVLGASSGVLQAVSSAVKLPLLFLLTLESRSLRDIGAMNG
jgi:hypothetical protein